MAHPTYAVDHTRTAKCPELLCLTPALLVSGWPNTTSKDITPSSSLVRAHAPNRLPPSDSRIHTYSAGLCKLLRAPAGNRFFPTLSPQFFPQMPGPQPRRSHRVLLPVSSSVSSAFPGSFSSRLTVVSANAIFHGEVSRLSSDISFVQASEFARLPDRSHRCQFHRAAETSTSGQNVLRCLCTHRICYPSDTGN
jgi:hypothetical protein